MVKQSNALKVMEDLKEGGIEGLMEAMEEADPEEARLMLQTIVEAMDEAGETVPLATRLLASNILFGLSQTPVGLVYGVGGLGHLIVTGFITEEDIEETGDPETILQMIMDEFEEDIPGVVVRDDEAMGVLIKNALEGSHHVTDEVFEGFDGTNLQRAVWKELTQIPYGETISYEELAMRVGKPKAVRAVASAVGENPLSIAIPCHRVVLKSGEIGEYHWGSDVKEKLLAYEKARKQA